MKPTLYLRISGCIFSIVSLGHLIRLCLGVPVVVGNVALPQWVSWVGCPATLTLAVWAFMLPGRQNDAPTRI